MVPYFWVSILLELVEVLFMNTSPNLEWNNLPLKGIFAPLITRMVVYLSSKQNDNSSYLPGQAIDFSVKKLAFPLIDARITTRK